MGSQETEDDWEVFREIRRERQQKRATRLAEADETGWSKFTPHHWYRDVVGHRLEWWPSGAKWKYRGKFYRGGLPRWLRELVADPAGSDTTTDESGENAHG